MTADKRRTDACRRACEGISTKNLEDNVPFLELARRYNVVLRERDALRAKIAEMERQEPAGYGVRYVEPTNGEEDWDSIWKYRVFAEDHIKDFTQAYADVGEPVGASTVVPLYALPGAKGEKDV